jgi:hypothetical protein
MINKIITLIDLIYWFPKAVIAWYKSLGDGA